MVCSEGREGRKKKAIPEGSFCGKKEERRGDDLQKKKWEKQGPFIIGGKK